MQSSDEKIDLELSGGRQYDRWEQETILPLTSVLLESIPFDLYPYSTERDFPHVLNVLARHWSDRAAFIEAAGSLLHVQDGPRQGFPRLVFFEILGLVAYHGSLPDLGHLDLRHLNLDLTDSVQQRLLE